MTSTGIVPAASAAALEPLDPAARELAVTAYLQQARSDLALAVEMSGPAAVAAVKAQIATAAEATKQLGLSKEIRDDALEMVRRAEYALGKAIRAGQEAGEIAKKGDIGGVPPNAHTRSPVSEHLARPRDFVEGSRTNVSAIYELVDDVAEPEFDAAINDARAEGNLSRANVVRKIRGAKADSLTPVERLTLLRELAPSGMTAAAIAADLGVTERYVRERAAEHGIEITAEKVIGKARRLDANRVIESLVIEAASVVSLSLLAQVHFDDLNPNKLGEWISSLSESEKALRRLRRDLEKELHRV